MCGTLRAALPTVIDSTSVFGKQLINNESELIIMKKIISAENLQIIVI